MRFFLRSASLILLGACASASSDKPAGDSAARANVAADDSPRAERGGAAKLESAHLSNPTQLTHGSANAEAYFSHDGTHLIFQSTRDGRTCDQQYTMKIDGARKSTRLNASPVS